MSKIISRRDDEETRESLKEFDTSPYPQLSTSTSPSIKSKVGQIKMVDLGGQYQRLKSEIDLAIQEVVDSERFIGGPAVEGFASEFAKYNMVDHVIPCGNGTDALQIAIMAMDYNEGDEIITPSFTFVATAESIAIQGLKPVFAEVDSRTFTLSPESIESKITSKTRAILPVHLYGQNADMQSIMELALKYNLDVIEDAAQSVGANYSFTDGRKAKSGTIGKMGTLSFFPSKNLGCFGDGGAIFTNDDSLAMKCKEIATHGHKKKYWSIRIGMNSRLDPMQASILRVKLKHLNDSTNRRNKAADIYDSLLSRIDQIEIPERINYSEHVFHQYTIKVKDAKRDDLKVFLQGLGIPSLIYYPHPVHLQPAYEYLKTSSLPVSEILVKEVLSLPMHTELTAEQQEYIAEGIIKYFKENG